VVATLKRLVWRTLFHRFSPRELFILVVGVCCLSIAVLFAPYLRSMRHWCSHRTIFFEGGSVSLPSRWIAGEKGHLLCIQRPGLTILFPFSSTIDIDPFAERWPADKTKTVSDIWLRIHGSPVGERVGNTQIGWQMKPNPNLRCVSPSRSTEYKYIQIYCISADSVHSFEFFGEQDAIPAFEEVSAQASHIADKHPGIILRK